MNNLLTIVGPTSSGKTDLALYLAEKFNGELISADSRQVYIGLDIGTGKLPSENNGQLTMENGKIRKGQGHWEINGIRIWLYDVISPKKQYTVSNYVKDANKIINEIIKKEKLPILVGGSGLYIRALLNGLSNLSIPFDKKLREKLEKLSLSDLQKKLKKISEKKWESMNYSDQQNPRRLVRAIEVLVGIKCKKDVISGLKEESNILKIGLTANRETLYQRSDERVISRIKQGMIDEAQRLKDEGVSLERFRQLGLEYGILADFLENKIQTIDELIKVLQNKIHGYIRRQLTWFKKEENVNWFEIVDTNTPFKIEKLVRKWYDSF